MKNIILAAAIAITTASVLFYALNTYQNRDKFQVGDCVETVYETEFYRTVYYDLVIKVGKEAYLTSTKAAGESFFFRTNNFEWKFSLNRKDKTDAQNCAVAK